MGLFLERRTQSHGREWLVSGGAGPSNEEKLPLKRSDQQHKEHQAMSEQKK